MRRIKRLLLTGHSGCRLELCQSSDNGELFVRKTSSSAGYNERLKRQYIKQVHFRHPSLQTPATLRYGYDNSGLFWFDMEYIKGKTLASYMKDIHASDIKKYVDLLFVSIPSVPHPKQANPCTQFSAKIADLAQGLPLGTLVVASALSKLQAWDFSSVPASPCAGDLTLENIIVKEKTNELYLIDFLDSFFDSWMIDVAKLLQDVECGWSWRTEPEDANRNLRCILARKCLLEKLSMQPDGALQTLQVYHILLLNLLRITPYTNDKITLNFLNNALEKVLNKILKMEKRG